MDTALKRYKLENDGPLEPIEQAKIMFNVFSHNGNESVFYQYFVPLLDENGNPRYDKKGNQIKYSVALEVHSIERFEKFYSDSFGCNSYISVNCFDGKYILDPDTGKKKPSREAIHCSKINDIFVDIDLSKELKDNYDAKTCDEIIDNAIAKATKLLGPATIILFSGRGAQLHYLYDSPISKEDLLAVSKHRILYEKVYESLKELYDEKYIDLDHSVINDDARICRLAGSVNSKSNRMAILREVNPDFLYNLDAFCAKLSIDTTTITSTVPSFEQCDNDVPFLKKGTLCKSEEKKEKKERLKAEHTSEGKIPKRVPSSDKRIHTASKKTYDNYKGLVNSLKCFAKDRGMKDGDKRSYLLLIFYSAYRHIGVSIAAQQEAQWLNASFDEPLENERLQNIFITVEKKIKRNDPYQRFNREKIAKNLNMSEKEIINCGILKNQRKKRKTRENKITKKNAFEEINQYLLAGKKKSEIATILAAKTGRHPRTIYNWIDEIQGVKTKVPIKKRLTNSYYFEYEEEGDEFNEYDDERMTVNEKNGEVGNEYIHHEELIRDGQIIYCKVISNKIFDSGHNEQKVLEEWILTSESEKSYDE